MRTPLELDRLLAVVTSWLDARTDVLAVALVGSHARGAARPDSDVDVMIVVAEPALLRRDTAWVHAIPWTAIGRRVVRWEDADYGVAWSRHVLLARDAPAPVSSTPLPVSSTPSPLSSTDTRVLEVELCFAGPAWLATTPIDEGTRYVLDKGCRVLRDKTGALATVLATRLATQALT